MTSRRPAEQTQQPPGRASDGPVGATIRRTFLEAP